MGGRGDGDTIVQRTDGSAPEPPFLPMYEVHERSLDEGGKGRKGGGDFGQSLDSGWRQTQTARDREKGITKL